MIRMTAVFILSALLASVAIAGSDPILERQGLMEDTKDAAKVIGDMLRKNEDFSAHKAMKALEVWQKTANEAGNLFPDGSDVGHDTEAKATVWTDRAGFDLKMIEFGKKVDAAIAAKPASLEELKKVAGPVFETCKGCHEGYRVDKD